MDTTTEAGAIFENHRLRENKALLLDITIVDPCASSNLENAAHHAGKHLADAVKRKKNKHRGSFPATYSLLPLAMSTCGDVGLVCSHREARHQTSRALVGDTLQRLPASGGSSTSSAVILFRFTARTFIPHTSPPLQTEGGACEHPTVPFGRPEGVVTGSEGREGANGVGGGIRGGNGDGSEVGVGNGNVNDDGDGGEGEQRN